MKHADYLSVRALWALRWKDGSRSPLLLLVEDGDRPFYAARHVGMVGSAGSNAIIAYGIGKLMPSGDEEPIEHALFGLPGGAVCSGVDVDRIGRELVMAMGPRP